MPGTTFITGANGCIGAWVVKAVVERGERPTVFDLADDPRRMRLVMEEDAIAQVRFVQGDVTELAPLRAALEASGAARVIHLAGLQVPFCKADPPLGARVNVVGTLNVFEAARTLGLERVVYASSAAVYGPDGDDPSAVDESDPCEPTTHYGVFKRANEGNARVYWHDSGISSAGLRPLTVYGVARDQGLTSDLTRAIKAAVLGRAFTIRFGGATDALYTADVADAFLACADRAPRGAHVFNLHGDALTVQRFVELVDQALEPRERGRIKIAGGPLPIAAALDDGAIQRAVGELLHTPVAAGVRETVARFRALHAEGRLDTRDLDA